MKNGHKIDPKMSDYYWLGSLIGNRKLLNVAAAADAAVVSKQDPTIAWSNLLRALKKAVDNNFMSAFFMLGAAAMAIHYEAVLGKYAMCPTPVAIGKKNTGKSTAVRAVLAALGTPQFFIRDFTATAPSVLSCKKTFPTVFDDPSDLAKVKALIANSYNRGGRGTSKPTCNIYGSVFGNHHY